MTSLTSRQEQVARYVSLGWSDKQIAGALEISMDAVTYAIGRIAKAWKLDPLRNLRVQIAHRFLNVA